MLSTTTSAKRGRLWFPLTAGLGKYVLLNSAGVALNASGNTVTLWTSNLEAQ